MPVASSLAAQSEPPGKAVYDKWCAGCHGDQGAGDGDAAHYMLPRPRDFTKGVFQIRTTASGELQTDDDLLRIIAGGMPGTAMPDWKGKLTVAEMKSVIAYIKTFSRFFQNAKPQPITIGSAPSGGADAVKEGRAAFQKLECFKCHGQAGRGDGPSAPTLKDDAGFPIRAADLTESWNFNGGSEVEQIYARLRTGLDGTPMPSFNDVIDAKVITDAQLWRVAQYVRGLSADKPPEVREVIRAQQVIRLPTAPGDSIWSQAAPAYVPLVGQIIRAPRWFTPTVDGLWVQALHDGKRLALRLVWHDPSRSPDSAWQEWQGRIAQTVARDDTTALVQGPDRLLVQFPVQVTDDTERPYFLGGSTRRPVHLWRWASDQTSVEEGSGTGLGRFAPASRSQVTHAARFDQGEWQLQLTRSLLPADTTKAPTFTPGRAIPIGFLAADGSSGEDLHRAAISAWYAVYLDVPTPTRVYVQPVVAAMLTAGLGLFVVARAQRRPRRPGDPISEA